MLLRHAPRRDRAMRVVVAQDYAHMSALALTILRAVMQRRPDAVISLTTGRTPAGLYSALRDECHAARMHLAAARIISSEEYAGVGIGDAMSLYGWLCHEILEPCGLPHASSLYLHGDAPDPSVECRRFDGELARLGTIDLVVQTIGVNGHFGFNEPGTAPDAPSRLVTLAPSTRASNAAYWPQRMTVPAQGLAMSMQATLAARHVLLLAAGTAKADALARAIDGPIDQDVPCSLLRLAPRLTVLADAEAGSALQRHDGPGDAWQTLD